MPYELVHERYFTYKAKRSPFVQHASLFQDIVIRCVRYAFAKIPSSIGKVFFSRSVALPFFTFRKLRHGYLRSPIHWHEVNQVCLARYCETADTDGLQPGLKGLWLITDESKKPDMVVYYCHGMSRPVCESHHANGELHRWRIFNGIKLFLPRVSARMGVNTEGIWLSKSCSLRTRVFPGTRGHLSPAIA